MTINDPDNCMDVSSTQDNLSQMLNLPNCGLIMTTDGQIVAFSSLPNPKVLDGDVETLTEEQRAALVIGEKLSAIMLALANDQIMAILLDIARNTGVADLEGLKNAGTR